ncbi:MAG: MerR family transcriptional regulator [Sporichthyaceae bacterium]
MPIRRRAAPAPEVSLGVAAVARRLGVATGTLRTWDRRYGLGPSAHEAGTRRRYTAVDLGRLTLMRRLMMQGAAAADAASAAVAARPVELPGADEPLTAEPGGTEPRALRHATRTGGGRVVPVRDAGPVARGLARAAMALDGDSCSELLRTSVARDGVVTTWTEVLVPVLTGIGERWRSTGTGIEVEHLLSECAESVLRNVPAPGRPRQARPLLLAALEPEDHRLPLVALSAALAERRVATRLLGVRLPARALVDAVARTGAFGVFLWAQGAAGPGSVRLPPGLLDAVRPPPAVLLGGPGWDAGRAAPAATWLPDLATAADTVAALAGGGLAVGDAR